MHIRQAFFKHPFHMVKNAPNRHLVQRKTAMYSVNVKFTNLGYYLQKLPTVGGNMGTNDLTRVALPKGLATFYDGSRGQSLNGASRKTVVSLQEKLNRALQFHLVSRLVARAGYDISGLTDMVGAVGTSEERVAELHIALAIAHDPNIEEEIRSAGLRCNPVRPCDVSRSDPGLFYYGSSSEKLREAESNIRMQCPALSKVFYTVREDLRQIEAQVEALELERNGWQARVSQPVSQPTQNSGLQPRVK